MTKDWCLVRPYLHSLLLLLVHLHCVPAGEGPGREQAELDAAAAGPRDKEVPEPEGEVLEVYPAVPVMVQVSEYCIAVLLEVFNS